MHLSLRAAAVLLPLLLHDAQSAADEQISGRPRLRRNNMSSSSLSRLEESDKVSSPRERVVWHVSANTGHASCKISQPILILCSFFVSSFFSNTHRPYQSMRKTSVVVLWLRKDMIMMACSIPSRAMQTSLSIPASVPMQLTSLLLLPQQIRPPSMPSYRVWPWQLSPPPAGEDRPLMRSMVIMVISLTPAKTATPQHGGWWILVMTTTLP